jgi:heptose I phosphotransferase
VIDVRDDIAELFDGEQTIDAFLAIDGVEARRFGNRSTRRFERDGQGFYIKTHGPVGWWPIIEDLLKLRRPQVGARPEWEAIRAADSHGIPVPRIAAFGETGGLWSSRSSFLVTEEVAPAISLEELFETTSVSPSFRRRLIRAVAQLAKRLHESGLNHRDFYLCHFLLLDPPDNETTLPHLTLIDLHRAQVRPTVPRRWQLKDIAGLYFSAMDTGLSNRDLLLFLSCYSGRPLREILADEDGFWRDVRQRAHRLYRKIHGRAPYTTLINPENPTRPETRLPTRRAA